MMILAFPDYLSQAQRLAARLDVPLAEVVLHHFPDGESLIRLPPSLPEHVIVCRSLNQPNDKLIELLLCATTARELGAKRLTLVTPYLSYMRQDIANQPGEAVSQRIVGKLLAELFDDVLTVDPHLHRISSLTQAIPIKNAISLTAADEIGVFLKRQFKHALLLGPDSESKQWVAAIAENIGFDYAIAQKNRLGDKQVEMTLPDGDFCSKSVIIIDDMASTGR
ncbi:MAG: ribose-phosphate diphosphokinase [Methylobacter sp.]|nr:ribose-phosphate diphosphokinase [Methylobacter sp.]